MKLFWITLALCLFSHTGLAHDARFTVGSVDTAKQELALFLNDEAGHPFGGFSRLDRWLGARDKRLVFAGLLVQHRKEMAPLNLDKGVGNFLKPNSVFLVGKGGPRVVALSGYAALARGVRRATQSGLLLLRNGVIHPAFNPASTSRYIRNPMGVVGNKAIFVISNRAVTFHEFAVFFRDALKFRDALYLDGSVSSLFFAKLGRHDAAAQLGPILGVVE